MTKRFKITAKHILITNVSEFYKSIELCGVKIFPSFEWMDESDGSLSEQHLIESVLPASETYYAGRTRHTNAHGSYDGSSSESVITQSEIDSGNEPHGFHPYLSVEVDNGYVTMKKMDGRWDA